ncbi:MAG TPA: glucose-6-phosphate dehydrogenase assembly protein OpcA [Chloroflexia bacterium]|nr:glucose-6-phosphate dehydrogenase assembly protein OpcA [Chloroflexia bacterium]
MDESHNKPPPEEAVESLAAESGKAMPIPADTLPTRPAAERRTGQGLPPPPDPQAGAIMPPPPAATHAVTPVSVADAPDGGLQRTLENLNLDANAQADPDTKPDRHSAEALLSIVEGGTMPVAVNNIDRELIAIWKSTTGGGDNEGKVAVTLMRAMNLVVYVDNDEGVANAHQMVTRIIGRHPCRTIMIVNRSGATTVPNPDSDGNTRPAADDLEASISAYCQLADSLGKHVCCEQISVQANSPAALGRVSNVALNLLITDLPVFLWWAGDRPFQNSVLTNLEDNIDRLIVDSSLFADPLAGLLAMARVLDPAFRRAESARYAPGDFNWDRIEGLREATAQVFDTAGFTSSLGRIGSLEIQYARPAEGQLPNPVQAFLFAAWMASRLGWEFHSSAPVRGGGPGDVVLTLRQGVRSIPILLRANEGTTSCAGGILRVLLTTNEIRPTTFAIAMADDNLYMDCTVTSEGTESAVRKLRHSPPDDFHLLDSQMEVFGHDEIFEEALVMAGIMAWGSLSLNRRAEVSAQIGEENRQSSFDPRF